MKTYPVLAVLILLAASAAPALAATASAAANAPTVVPANPSNARLTFPFDASWRFLQDDATGAEQTAFDDSAWRLLDVPHDWTIAGPFAETNPAVRGGAYLPTGIGWYRKTFTLPLQDANKRVAIDFDGIMANADVWINGFHLGKRPNGYVAVHYDMSSHLNYGPDKTNVLAVRVDNSIEPASRYYTGSGIERHVHLTVTDPVHVENGGLYVTTPIVTPASATVHVQTFVANESNAPRAMALQITLIGPDGQPAQTVTTPTQNIEPGLDKGVAFEQDITVANPKLWDLDQPNLYQAVCKVMDGPKAVDDASTTFGIRKMEFKPETGFWLNGKNIKILGVALHQDGGAVGEAVPLSIYADRIAAVKAMGANAIRWSHNPPSTAMLDLCDRMGVLVMDEMFDCWLVGKPNAEKGYNLFFKDWSLDDLRDTVVRDRNHPSIFIYSAGNEIHDTSANATREEEARVTLWGLISSFHQFDPTRPVTQALFRPETSHDYTSGFADLLDVVGTNYRDSELIGAQQAKPTRTLLNTEELQDLATWIYMRNHPQLSGCFLWSGIDYLGEGATLGGQPGADDPSGAWPNINSGSGLFDRTVLPKAAALQRESWWSTKPVVHIVRSRARDEPGPPLGSSNAVPKSSAAMVDNWTPLNPANYPNATVHILSNCDDVELFLNGQSLGSKPKPADDSPRIWTMPYAPGNLKAVGKNGGKEVASEDLQSAGPPAKIILTAERVKIAPTFDDVVCVRAIVADANGVRTPWADNLITFKTTGPGTVIATDNGFVSDHTPFPSSQRNAYEGNCIAYLRATESAGSITLTASADGLTAGTVTLTAVAAGK